MEFLVDPFLVLVPADGGTAEWLTFFERISDWATALRDRDVAASSAIVAELHACLHGEGGGPFHGSGIPTAGAIREAP